MKHALAPAILIASLIAAPAAAQTSARTSAQTSAQTSALGAISLADVSRSLAATTSMTARFTQTASSGATLAGKMALARPGKVRFEYDKAKILLVGDGRNLTFVDYAVRQVSQWPVKSTPLGILLSAEPDLTGLATIIGTSDAGLIVEARDPKRPEFGTLAIRFTRQPDAPGGLALAGWTARDAQGNTSEIRLTDVLYNADLRKADWSFRDPRRQSQRAG